MLNFLFGSTSNDEKVLKPGGFLGAVKFTIDDSFVNYHGRSGDRAVVPKHSIKAITLSPGGFGKSVLIFIGEGTELARVSDLPTPWATKSMKWLIHELKI